MNLSYNFLYQIYPGCHEEADKKPESLHRSLIDGKVLREVILYGGYDGLHELEEDNEVGVDSHLSSTLCHRLYYLLHHLRVPGVGIYACISNVKA